MNGFQGDRIVRALAVTETVSWGVLYYAIGALVLPMERDLGWSRSTVLGAFSLGLLVQGLCSLPVGRWLDRHGARGLMTAGSAAAALLVAAWSQVQSVAAYYVLWAGLGAAMAAVLYEPAFAVVTRWFVRRRARALLTITLCAGLASTIFVPLTDALVARFGWRQALVSLAVGLAAITIPLHALVLRRDPSDLGQQVDGARNRVEPLSGPPDTTSPALAPATPAAGVRDVLRSREFVGLAAAFVLSAIGIAAVGVHLVPMLVERGFASPTAAAVAGLVGLMQLPGRLLHPALQRALPPGRVTALLLAAQAAAVAVLAAARGLVPVLLGASLLGMASGLLTLARATEVADRFGVERYGRISGALAFGTTLARAAGPITAAALLPTLGGYGGVLLLLALLIALAAALAGRA